MNKKAINAIELLKRQGNKENIQFPRITVNLKGYKENPVKIIEKVSKVMRRHKVSEVIIRAYQEESKNSKPTDLLIIAKKWVNVNY